MRRKIYARYSLFARLNLIFGRRRRAMPLLLIGIIAVVSLLFLASLALAVMRQTRNAREDGP